MHHMQTREVLEAMLADVGRGAFEVLLVDGGASQNGLLMQLQADAIQVCALRATSRSPAPSADGLHGTGGLEQRRTDGKAYDLCSCRCGDLRTWRRLRWARRMRRASAVASGRGSGCWVPTYSGPM